MDDILEMLGAGEVSDELGECHTKKIPSYTKKLSIEECIKTYIAVEAWQSLCTKRYPQLKSKTSDKRNPIGRKLLVHRGNHDIIRKVEPYDMHKDLADVETSLSQVISTLPTIRTHPAMGQKKTHNKLASPSLNDLNKNTGIGKGRGDTCTWKRKKCQMVGCNSTAVDNALRSVPTPPTAVPDNASEARQITFAVKTAARKKILDRLGLGFNCELKYIRYCVKHPIEDFPMTVKCQIRNHTTGKALTKQRKIIVKVPKSIGRCGTFSSPLSPSKGSASDRAMTRQLLTLSDDSHALAHMQAWEMKDVTEAGNDGVYINTSVAKVARTDYDCIKQNPESQSKIKGTIKRVKSPKVGNKHKAIITWNDLVPTEVNRLTGFGDIVDLVSFILIACRGDLTKMCGKVSELTWLEEWLLYFEYVYGRVHRRWADYEKLWNVSRSVLRKVVWSKLELVRNIQDI